MKSRKYFLVYMLLILFICSGCTTALAQKIIKSTEKINVVTNVEFPTRTPTTVATKKPTIKPTACPTEIPTRTYTPTQTSTPDIIYPTVSEKGQLYFGDYLELPKTSYMDELVAPYVVILHTDAQSLKIPDRWYAMGTYYGLDTTKSVHFAVCQDGILQMLPMFEKEVVYAKGTSPQYDGGGVLQDWNARSIQIEMCGRDYDLFVTGDVSEDMAHAVFTTTENTVDLVIALMYQYNIPIENIFGHYQVQRGKVDPGQIYLEQYFLPILKEKIDNLNK